MEIQRRKLLWENLPTAESNWIRSRQINAFTGQNMKWGNPDLQNHLIPMKVLHVITSLLTGGAEKLMVDLLPRLRDAGHEVELAIFNGRITPFYEQLQAKNITIHRFMPEGGNVYNPINLWKLVHIIRKGHYDIVHTHNTAPQLFAAIGSVLCSVALCTTEHNTSNRRRGWKWYATIDRWMYSRYKTVICISDKTEENLRNFIHDDSDKFKTIYNGIDTRKYHEAHPVDLKSRYEGCQTALIQVAGFRYQKDQDTVIKAMKSLPESVHLFLVGDGPRRQFLENLIETLKLNDRVHLLGIRSDVAGLLKGADMAVMSSHWEGFGLAAVEAMAAGLPVIATDIDGLAQVVGDAGVLFEHDNAARLAHEISSLIDNPIKYNALKEAGYKRAEEFDILKMAEEYNKLYLEL